MQIARSEMRESEIEVSKGESTVQFWINAGIPKDKDSQEMTDLDRHVVQGIWRVNAERNENYM